MKKYFIANWKLYLTIAKSELLATRLLATEKTNARRDVEFIVAPSMLALSSVVTLLKRAKSKIKIAAQDCGFADEGAFTGAVSPNELKKMGASYVIIGHSERRQYFAEDAALISKKITAARAAGLKIIYCVGETKDERNVGRAQAVVKEQLRGFAKDVDVIAYEPRWAIGTGIAIEPAEAEQMHEYISREVGGALPICYGGSVSDKNIAAFTRLQHSSGVLVGFASTTLQAIVAMLQKI
ncbi:MAG: triose-phosphate isomerase [Candidatus Magasanikbacteria bacterium]|nr:triose-phosphate isomerase [Candidatus Magasanikbacteria bacterium]